MSRAVAALAAQTSADCPDGGIGDTLCGDGSLGLSGRAHVLVIALCLVAGVFLLRLLRRRQLRGKYTLLWIVVGTFVLLIASVPSLLDRTSQWLNIRYAPSTLFLASIAFLLMVCVYFSYELSKLEERTRLLAEELAILRGQTEHTIPEPIAPELAIAEPATDPTAP